MINTILVTFGALVVATSAGALLAPAEWCARRMVFRSQWSTRQVPIAVPPIGAPNGESHAH